MIGKRVYIKELDQFGTVVEVQDNGIISKVQINTPTGTKVINTIRFVILIMDLIEPIIPRIKRWIDSLRKK